MYLISNLISANPNASWPYRYFRLYDASGNSKCELVEMNFYGFKSSDTVESNGNLTCDVEVSVNQSPAKVFTSAVSYIGSKTYIIQSIIPNYGDMNGATPISIELD